MTGVNCYVDKDQCQRAEPKPAEMGSIFGDMGVGVILGVFGVAVFLCCLHGIAYYFISEFKCAHDQLVRSLFPANTAEGQAEAVLSSNQRVGVESVDTIETEEQLEDETNGISGSEVVALLENDQGGYRLMSESPSTAAQTSIDVPQRYQRLSCMYHLYHICIIIGLFIIIPVAVFGIFRYSPSNLSYNICTNAKEWKSIVSAMSSVKTAEERFELLISVRNSNNLDVSIDLVKGAIVYDDAYVGTFEIPPKTKTKAMTVTDVLAVVSFDTEKWTDLKLTKAYKNGRLEFFVDVPVAAFRTPYYSFEGAFPLVHVRVKDPTIASRHLCACKNMDSMKM